MRLPLTGGCQCGVIVCVAVSAKAFKGLAVGRLLCDSEPNSQWVGKPGLNTFAFTFRRSLRRVVMPNRPAVAAAATLGVRRSRSQ